MAEKLIKLRWYFLFALLMAGFAGYAAEPFTIYDYFRLRTISEFSVSPDGRHVAFTLNVNRPIDKGKGNDYRELYLKDLNTGTVEPLITGENYLVSLSWTPDSRNITFRARFNDIKSYQVFGYNLEDKKHEQLTGHTSGIIRYAWNPAGNGLAFTAENKADQADRKLREMGFDAEVFEEEISDINLYWQHDQETTELYSSGAVFDFAWSPDGNHIAAQIAPENLIDHQYMFKDLYLIETGSEKSTLWLDVPGKLSRMAWSPDGKHLAFVAGSDVSDPVDGSLFSIEIGKQHSWENVNHYTEGFEGSVTDVNWLDENTILFSAEERVETTMSTIPLNGTLNGKKRRVLIKGQEAVFTSFDKNGGKIFMIGTTPNHPEELYSMVSGEKKLTRETFSNPWLEKRKLARQEKISYTARDGLRIDGVLIYPADFQEGKKYPMICMIHGGPESAMLNGWNTSYSRWGQIAASQDYFVFMPNYRASSGRGVEFSKMDQMDLGDEEFLDVIDGIEYLAAKGYVDKKKVGIGGGSYGGYFSALGATRYSGHFAAAIPFVGVSNHLSKVNLTDIPYEIYLVHWKIWPNENPELMYDRSPVKYSSNNRTPTLILHGKEDTRVHPSQSLELYRQLKLHGKAPVRLVLYPEEGHGNRNNPAQLDFNLRTMRWFNHYLKGEGDPKELPPIDVNYQLEKLGELEIEQGS
ncbi:MAG: S9 family peptidase [Cyclobacteriaceae bacterium]|nr:S9 family peptidase [Cyclobacteriaceae bacterium]